MASSTKYDNWSREQLIARLNALEGESSSSQPQSPFPSDSASLAKTSISGKAKPTKSFNFDSYPARKIALKFCYYGAHYNGLAFQPTPTPLPTVEGVLFDALASTKLVDGSKGLEGCGWERCGRTDRGVSSAGQVVSLWVRSNVGQPPEDDDSVSAPVNGPHNDQGGSNAGPSTSSLSDRPKREIEYVRLLNRVLPPTIRILASSSVHSSFSSRFNCLSRHYKYFFSPHGLNLDAMRDACSRLVGEHDFRNMCKVDASKQVQSYKRKILRAEVSYASIFEPSLDSGSGSSELERANGGEMCVFDLVGTAFLYNQVRHIMALLFLIGSGLEEPSLITSMLNADPSQPEKLHKFRGGDILEGEEEKKMERVETKPEYQMADPLPLVLWDCAYREEDVKWEVDPRSQATDDVQSSSDIHDAKSVYRHISSLHTRSLIETTLSAAFLRAATRYHPFPHQPFPITSPRWEPAPRISRTEANVPEYLNVPLGGGSAWRVKRNLYVPVLERKRGEHVDVVNERWRVGKGGRRAERKAAAVAGVGDGDQEARSKVV